MVGLRAAEAPPTSGGDIDHLTATATGAAGLASAAARWTIAFAWVMGVASGLLSGVLSADSPMILAGYLVVLLGAFLLTTPGDAPLRWLTATGVVACSLTAGTLVLLEGPSGSVYLFDYASFMVALLIARGNPWHGAVGGAGMVLGTVAWGSISGAPTSVVTDLVALAVMSQVLGVVWRLVLRRIVRIERWHRSESAEARRATKAAKHATRLVEEELGQVRMTAQPVLQRIADGAPMTDDLLRDVAIVEGTIRDRLRAPAFRHPLLVEAIARLRARGVDVTVVSPRDLEPVSDTLAARIVSALEEADAQRVVLRATRRAGTVSLTLRQDGVSHIFAPDDSQARPSPGGPAKERWST